jgi:hypothetical protein
MRPALEDNKQNIINLIRKAFKWIYITK